MNTTTALKVHFKIDPPEFTAEGATDVVVRLYDDFVGLVRTREPLHRPPVNYRQSTMNEADDDHESEEQNEQAKDSSPPIRSEHLVNGAAPKFGRLFEDNGNTLSLRRLPQTGDVRTDALILLLLGYRVLRNQQNVLAGPLLKGAKDSGVKIDDRVARILKKVPHLVIRPQPGQKSPYRLTNPGVDHAMDIANKLLAQE